MKEGSAVWLPRSTLLVKAGPGEAGSLHGIPRRTIFSSQMSWDSVEETLLLERSCFRTAAAHFADLGEFQDRRPQEVASG